jgi:hypothetical protein
LRFFHTLPIIPQSVALFQLHRFGLDRLMSGETPPAHTTLIPPKGITVRRSTEVLAINDEQTRRALQHILSHPTLRITPEEVAQASGIPRRHLEE